MCRPCSSEDGKKRGQQQAAATTGLTSCTSRQPRHSPEKQLLLATVFFNSLGTHHWLLTFFLLSLLGHDKLAAAATRRNFIAKKAASYQCSEILLFGEQSLPERGEEVVGPFVEHNVKPVPGDPCIAKGPLNKTQPASTTTQGPKISPALSGWPVRTVISMLPAIGVYCCVPSLQQ